MKYAVIWDRAYGENRAVFFDSAEAALKYISEQGFGLLYKLIPTRIKTIKVECEKKVAEIA